MTRGSLKELRDKLKNRDEKIVKLLNERARISLEIGKNQKKSKLEHLRSLAGKQGLSLSE